ncbi:MAG: sigma-70 family RNA polymerase sigma factor [Chitinispirillaceae bacterium]|nr:sigma-70 family RNA polymerase sigma factor [Chitinispirillaceae bacterium]
MTIHNRRAIAAFFSREYGRLAGFVRTLIDDAADGESEDIVQEVALSIFSRADITAPIEDVASYVYQALRNRVIDLFRRRHPLVSLDNPVGKEYGAETFKDIFPDERQDILRLLEDKEAQKRLWKEIDTLPDDQKTVLIATEFHEKTFSELSDQWRIPIGTLLARKSRAIARLRRKIKNQHY